MHLVPVKVIKAAMAGSSVLVVVSLPLKCSSCQDSTQVISERWQGRWSSHMSNCLCWRTLDKVLDVYQISWTTFYMQYHW